MRFFQTRFGERFGESSPPVPTRSAEARFIRTPGANPRRARTARADAGNVTQPFQAVMFWITGWKARATLADLNPRTVQKIEAGDIPILVTTLQRLRAALGCEWKRLLG